MFQGPSRRSLAAVSTAGKPCRKHSRFAPDLLTLEQRALLATLTVSSSPPSPTNFNSVAAAVSASNANDTILVSDGTWSISGVTISKPLTLVSVNGPKSGSTGTELVGGISGGPLTVANTNNVTIGGPGGVGSNNGGFLIDTPSTDPGGNITSITIKHSTAGAPIQVENDVFTGMNGVGNNPDYGVWCYDNNGPVAFQSDTFQQMWTGLLLDARTAVPWSRAARSRTWCRSQGARTTSPRGSMS